MAIRRREPTHVPIPPATTTSAAVSPSTMSAPPMLIERTQSQMTRPTPFPHRSPQSRHHSRSMGRVEAPPQGCRHIQTDDIETGVSTESRDESVGCPLTGQAVSGMEATRARSAASAWNGRRPSSTLLVRFPGGREGVARALSWCEYRCEFGWRTGS